MSNDDPYLELSRRVIKETKRVVENPPDGILIIPVVGNPRHFRVTIAGPQNTPYAGGVFSLEIFLPLEYPMVPPKCHFLTKIYHPNIDRVGRICLDILKDRWSPAFQIDKVCLSIQVLLQVPNPDDPLDPSIAKEMTTDKAKFLAKAKKWTINYAKQ